ncbi:phosphoenolpyruvate--protein phosphotransferase [Aerococcus sanguinicola]|uniref:phosphoenolpyruvate--protein phosphotransferase n=1 Tax=Aerococcus sanguinicola TaxID=119206 RepID=UPI0018A79B08|nr:phosphoenolpyruvate--protein phosphotransferase [Aerococcus sanguinicola]
MTLQLTGIAASDGIAIAKAYSLAEPDLSFEEKTIEDAKAEQARFEEARLEAREEIEKVYESALENVGPEAAAVFDAHLQMIDDPEFNGQITAKIESDKVNAEAALRQVADFFIQTFEAMVDNAYMQERAADVRDVSNRILAKLLGVNIPNAATIDEEAIVIARDLTPSDTAQLNKQYVLGFATDIGGRTSHSAIMARSLEIPAVVGTAKISQSVNDGDIVVIDGLDGEVIVNPTEEELATYREKAAAFEEKRKQWALLKDAETVTKDGQHFELCANIGTPKDVDGALNNGAEGIGLYRTEFLYMDSDEMPTEEAQYESYKKVLEAMGDKAVVIRTMDIGGDKELPYMDLPEEMNPFLGYRAIRIALDQKDLFRTQLRALLRASAHGHLKIMFPMIASLQEFREAKSFLEEVRQELEGEGHEVASDIEVGIMIEIPAAAVLADQFAKEVDFFSIGTNDLIQYTMAADRMNEHVSYLYQPYNPSVLRLIKHVIDSSHKEGKWTGMCGEMAGDQIAAPLLVGMGLDEFSMSASSILRTKALMAELDTKEMAALADKALNEATTADEVVALVKQAVKID